MEFIIECFKCGNKHLAYTVSCGSGKIFLGISPCHICEKKFYETGLADGITKKEDICDSMNTIVMAENE